MVIDARDQGCPKPVMMAEEALSKISVMSKTKKIFVREILDLSGNSSSEAAGKGMLSSDLLGIMFYNYGRLQDGNGVEALCR